MKIYIIHTDIIKKKKKNYTSPISQSSLCISINMYKCMYEKVLFDVVYMVTERFFSITIHVYENIHHPISSRHQVANIVTHLAGTMELCMGHKWKISQVEWSKQYWIPFTMNRLIRWYYLKNGEIFCLWALYTKDPPNGCPVSQYTWSGGDGEW